MPEEDGIRLLILKHRFLRTKVLEVDHIRRVR
jgi:hypothetical protein